MRPPRTSRFGKVLLQTGLIRVPSKRASQARGPISVPSLGRLRSGALFPCKPRPLRDLTPNPEPRRKSARRTRDRSEKNRLSTRRERLAPTGRDLRAHPAAPGTSWPARLLRCGLSTHIGATNNHLDPATPLQVLGQGHYYEITGLDEFVGLDPSGLPVLGEFQQHPPDLIKVERPFVGPIARDMSSSKPGAACWNAASQSSRFHASKAARTISTFSRDIATPRAGRRHRGPRRGQ